LFSHYQLDGYETQDLLYDPTTRVNRRLKSHINWSDAFEQGVKLPQGEGKVVTVSDSLSSYAIAPLPLLNFTAKSLGQDPDVVFVRGNYSFCNVMMVFKYIRERLETAFMMVTIVVGIVEAMICCYTG
jgi:hypothetical protein